MTRKRKVKQKQKIRRKNIIEKKINYFKNSILKFVIERKKSIYEKIFLVTW